MNVEQTLKDMFVLVMELAERVEALEDLAAEYESERQQDEIEKLEPGESWVTIEELKNMQDRHAIALNEVAMINFEAGYLQAQKDFDKVGA
ncbi:TPA: hypothetical protein ACIVOM_003605 [Salmonella enterica subsp. enterica serovar Virchow]